MEDIEKLYEMIKMLSEENLSLYRKLKKYEKVDLFKQDEDEELVKCDNCGDLVPEDYLSDNDFITEGGRLNICMQCIENGYGQ